MNSTKHQGRRGTLVSKLLTMQTEAMRAFTVAEFYLAIGRAVRYLLRHGWPMDTVAGRIGLPTSECHLALKYADSPDVLKLRALVENWSWEKIKQSVVLVRTQPSPISG